MVSCQCSQYQGKTFLHWIGQMPINDFRKIDIGSVLNEVARVVKLLQTVLARECTVLLLVLHSTSIGSE